MLKKLKWRYKKNWCRKDQLKQYVTLEAITKEEYKEITGEQYVKN